MRTIATRQSEVRNGVISPSARSDLGAQREPWPRISIVVPSYNQAAHLDAALTSIVNQAYPHLELIVMDGGSLDGSVEIIRRHADHIEYWQSGPDGGQASALAEGFHRATGEVFGWLNSDDVLLPGSLRRIAREFATDSRCQWLYGNSHVVDDRGRLLWRRPVPVISAWELAHLSVYLPQESTFFRRSLYEATGGIDPTLHYALDYDLWLKFVDVAPPKHVDAFLGCFRFSDGQKSSHADAYRAEERAAKARLGHSKPSTLRSVAGVVHYRSRSLASWVSLERGRAPAEILRMQARVLRGETPKLGMSRLIAASTLGVGSVLGGVLMAAVVRKVKRTQDRRW